MPFSGIVTCHRVPLALAAIFLICLPASAQKSSTPPAGPYILNHRRTVTPAGWKNRTIKLQLGQEFSILMPAAKFRPNKLVLSQDILNFNGYQHVSPVIMREKSKASGRITFRSVAPGRESISIYHEIVGGVIQQTPFCVFNIAVEHPKRQTSPNPFVESTLDGHADLLKLSRVPFSDPTFRTAFGELYSRHLNAQNVTPERQHAVLTAIRHFIPEAVKWFQKSPSGPLYLQIRAAGMTGSPELAKYFESRLDNLDPMTNASAYNAYLLAFAQLRGEASVRKIAPLAGTAPARDARFFEEALRIATWNRFLLDEPRTRPFQDSGGKNSIITAWELWWKTRGVQVDWATVTDTR